MQNNIKGSDKAAGGLSLTNSPYVGGNKMSSSLKDKLKRFRKYSSPISKPSTSVVSAIKFKIPAHEYSKEEIENAMNEAEPEINKKGCSDSEDIILIDQHGFKENSASDLKKDTKICIHKPLSNENVNASVLMEDPNESVDSSLDEYVEICINVAVPVENEGDASFLNEDYENDMDKSGTKLNENVGSFSKESSDNGKDGSDSEISASCEIDNYYDEPVIKENEDICAFSLEDIENCADKEKVLEIFHALQKEYVENQEKFRKLNLVQKHHTKNSPEALKSLNQKWLACTQLALKKLYNFMPEPRTITFETFLIFLQVDFDAVKYNPETDSFV